MTSLSGVSGLLSPAAASSTTSGTTTSSSTDSTSATNQLNENTFLKLLVAQLQNQDPSQPADPTAFLTQTAQFTQVQSLDQLSTLDQQVLTSSQDQAAISMVGKTVTYTDGTGAAHTGAVTGASLGSQTPNVTIGGASIPYSSITGVTS